MLPDSSKPNTVFGKLDSCVFLFHKVLLSYKNNVIFLVDISSKQGKCLYTCQKCLLGLTPNPVEQPGGAGLAARSFGMLSIVVDGFLCKRILRGRLNAEELLAIVELLTKSVF